jgi:hypothetical protein
MSLDLDQLAADIVVGGDGESRTLAAQTAERNPELRRKVETLERRLAPLSELLPPDAPPAGTFAGIEARIAAAKAVLPGTVTLRAGAYDWQRLSEGIDMALLWVNEKAKRKSLLIRMQPGARYESHEHEEDEECLVIEGDLEFGDLLLKAGDFHFAPKGRAHPPAYSPSGCLLFITAAA